MYIYFYGVLFHETRISMIVWESKFVGLVVT